MTTQNELEALRKELSETTERVKELEEFAKMAVEVISRIASEPMSMFVDYQNGMNTKMNQALNFQSSDIYKKVVGK